MTRAADDDAARMPESAEPRFTRLYVIVLAWLAFEIAVLWAITQAYA